MPSEPIGFISAHSKKELEIHRTSGAILCMAKPDGIFTVPVYLAGPDDLRTRLVAWLDWTEKDLVVKNPEQLGFAEACSSIRDILAGRA